jgi:2-iminobutanoate/2-iminopropanoate deaminase
MKNITINKDSFMKIIETRSAPAAIGPYSQAITAGNLVYTSGQIPLSPENGQITGNGIAEQAEQALQNLKAVLEAAGSSLEKVIKTTCFITDMNDFAAFNEVYTKYFPGKPARSCVAVKQLPKNALVEVEAVAELV